VERGSIVFVSGPSGVRRTTTGRLVAAALQNHVLGGAVLAAGDAGAAAAAGLDALGSGDLAGTGPREVPWAPTT